MTTTKPTQAADAPKARGRELEGELELRQYTVRRDDGSPYPDLGFEAMRDFLELRAQDPISFGVLELQRLIVTMKRLADTVWKEKAVVGQGWPSSLVLPSGWFDVNMSSQLPPGTLLSETLSSFKVCELEFVSLLMEFETTMNALAIEPELYEAMLTTAWSKLALLRKMYRLLKAEHLMLQNHLEHFVWRGMPTLTVEAVSKAESLYRPLTMLRDKYFDSPKSGMLKLYRDTVAAVEQAAEFEHLVEANTLMLSRRGSSSLARDLTEADARMLQLEVALEVAVLLD
jgi:hypothetical protein